jgi:Family of unknown function (DUF6263)
MLFLSVILFRSVARCSGRFRSAAGLIVLGLMLCVGLSGCNYFQGSKASDVDVEMAEMDEEGMDGGLDDGDEKESGSSDARSAGELELKLKVGDRFPLTKRIEQRLTQQAGRELSVYRSQAEMLLSLIVEEVRDGHKRLGVRYHRIRYSHDLAGKKVEYSSEASPQQPVPPEALAYAGLNENGFSFWIGPDNKVEQLVGFPEFLQRCVKDVPPQYRSTVMQQLEGVHSEKDLANFVDDGIGLLPYSNDPAQSTVAVKMGQSWDLKPRRTEGPIPVQVNTRCVLDGLTDTTADVTLVGKVVVDKAPTVVRDSGREMKVFVQGGHCHGTCKIDRKTGLPTNSQMSHFLEMSIQLADGSEILQRKETLTSVTSFLDQSLSRQTSAMSPHDSKIQQAGYANEAGSERRGR